MTHVLTIKQLLEKTGYTTHSGYTQPANRAVDTYNETVFSKQPQSGLPIEELEDTISKPNLVMINNNFKHHVPKEGQPAIYEEIRTGGKELALLIDSLCPNSREKSIAITKAEEAIFWANAAVARNK